MTSSTPIALSPWTRLLPIIPAAPVTATFMTRSSCGCTPLACPCCKYRSFQQLLEGDACGAELAHHDTAGAIRDRQRFAQGKAAGDHRGQRSDDGVASAGDVEHFASLRRHLHMALIVEQRHAV